MSKVKVLKPIAELIDGAIKEFEIGEEITLEEERAQALAKAGLVEIIEEKTEEKSIEEPPKDKMVHKTKNK